MSRNSMNGHRVHVVLTDPQYKAMTKQAKKTGLPFSELMRRAVDSFIHAERKKA